MHSKSQPFEFYTKFVLSKCCVFCIICLGYFIFHLFSAIAFLQSLTTWGNLGIRCKRRQRIEGHRAIRRGERTAGKVFDWKISIWILQREHLKIIRYDFSNTWLSTNNDNGDACCIATRMEIMIIVTFELRGDCIGDLRLSKEGEVFFLNSLSSKSS